MHIYSVVIIVIKVFIAGSEGTTGLRLKSRLMQRNDIELLHISDELRKDQTELKKFIQQSDYVFLCLPDNAAKEIVELTHDTASRIIDTSTAHRTADGWAYGFPELSQGHLAHIQNAKHVAVPGCHASGFISLIYPLITAGVISADCPLTCTSLTGYSGGGKKMIFEYENADREKNLDSTYLYAMQQNHKHLPEIMKQCALSISPIFMPVVGDFYSGMLVTVPLHSSMLLDKYSIEDIKTVYKKHYSESMMVKVLDDSPSALYTNPLAGRDDMEIIVSGTDDHILLCSRFDNLGKGASGAAIQCFNIMCGLPENTGLNRGQS